MSLSKRLQTVLNYIDASDKVADIGADHGYLTIAMYEKGVKHLQVVENKKGPLDRAKQNLMDYDNISFSLSDGISDLEPYIDTVTICGMGGLNIVEILNNNLDTAKSLKKIVMQANSKTYELREYLISNGFEIVDEDFVKDADQYYEIIVAIYNGNTNKLSTGELYFGPILLKKHIDDYIDYYLALKENIKKIILANPNRKMQELNDKLDLIEKYIKE